jgi:hypothetical protein
MTASTRMTKANAKTETTTKIESRYHSPSARELKRRKILYEAVSKKLTDEITGFTGLEHQPGESFEDYRSKEFQQACEILCQGRRHLGFQEGERCKRQLKIQIRELRQDF